MEGMHGIFSSPYSSPRSPPGNSRGTLTRGTSEEDIWPLFWSVPFFSPWSPPGSHALIEARPSPPRRIHEDTCFFSSTLLSFG